jgi:hypothetical protein
MTRAKQNGSLNLQGKGLKELPGDVCRFSELRLGENWWDCFELCKVDISNNMIEEIPGALAEQGAIYHINA